MNSDPHDLPPHIPKRTESPQLRWEMTTQGVGLGHVDGGWWPHSYDAAAEFPPLITALDARIGRVERIGYDMDLWHSAARKPIHGGGAVRFEGFHTVFARTVNIIANSGQRVILLVVPPGTGDDIAGAALHSASQAGSARTAEDILARADAATIHGVYPLTGGAPAPAPPDAPGDTKRPLSLRTPPDPPVRHRPAGPRPPSVRRIGAVHDSTPTSRDTP